MPWYLIFLDGEGKPCQRGPYMTRFKAQERLDGLDSEGEIYQLDTTDENKATRLLKEKRVEMLGTKEGTRNLSHRDSL